MFKPIASALLAKKSLKSAILLILFLAAYAGLSLPSKAQKLDRSQTLPNEPLAPSTPENTEYVLGAGDRIRISVFQVADFSGEYLVLVDGTITLPLLGTVSVERLTPSKLSKLLSERYTPYLKRPIVTVNVIQPRPLQIAVAGEVNKPGSYTITLEQGQKNPLVTDLIRQAGGITTVADIGKVQVRRVVQGQERVWMLNLWELVQNGDLSKDITLRDGDIIVVPSQETLNAAEIRQLAGVNFGITADQEINVAIVGEVNRPGAYKVVPQQGNTTIGSGTTERNSRQPPRLTLAIQLAGGIKPLADIRQIEVRRFTKDGNQQILKVDLWNLLQTGDINEDIILQEGDTIVIPTATELAPDEAEALANASFAPLSIRVNIVGEVVKPGTVEIPPNTPLNQAIMATGGFDNRRANKSQVLLVRLNSNGTVTSRQIPIDFAKGINDETNPALRNNDVIIVSRNWLTSTTDTLNTALSPLSTIVGLSSILRIFSGRY